MRIVFSPVIFIGSEEGVNVIKEFAHLPFNERLARFGGEEDVIEQLWDRPVEKIGSIKGIEHSRELALLIIGIGSEIVRGRGQSIEIQFPVLIDEGGGLDGIDKMAEAIDLGIPIADRLDDLGDGHIGMLRIEGDMGFVFGVLINPVDAGFDQNRLNQLLEDGGLFGGRGFVKQMACARPIEQRTEEEVGGKGR